MAMNPLEYEKRVKEERASLAATKNLSGPDGKIGVVLRFLGEPIVAQSEGDRSCFEDDIGVSWRSSEMPDLWLLDEPPEDTRNPVALTNNMPTMQGRHSPPEGPEWTTRKRERQIHEEVVGLAFDGLRRGMHLNILFLEADSVLTVHWQGRLVYKEVAGDLRGYVPSEDWEKKIDTLYELAKPKRAEAEKAKQENALVVKEKMRKSWMRSVIDRWGPQ